MAAGPDGPVRVQILSDIHLEFANTISNCQPIQEFEKQEDATILALLGDISYPTSSPYKQAPARAYKEFIYAQAEVFEHVLVITGNHEYYKSTRATADAAAKQICDECPTQNAHFMQRDVFDYGNVRFLGCTLWSHVPPESEGDVASSLTDYSAIKSDVTGKAITTAETNSWHAEDVEWIESQLALYEDESTRGDLPEHVAVLTHHAPWTQGVSNPVHDGSPINSAFATDLSHLLKSPVDTWAFGHTHYSSDQKIGDTRVVSNQLGYCMLGTPDKRFNPNFVLEIPSA